MPIWFPKFDILDIGHLLRTDLGSKVEWVESISYDSLGVSRVEKFRLTLNTIYHIKIMQKYILPSSTSILEFTADLIIDTLWRFMIGLGISFNYIESRKRLLFTYLSIA